MRLRFPLLLAVATLVAAASVAADSPGAGLPVPQDVFVLAGQSNMLGRALPVSSGAPSNPHLLVWRQTGWAVAADPLGDPSDAENGVGPGMTFGLSVARTLAPRRVGLVMCAVSGTTISKWEPPHSVYEQCIAQVRAAGGHIAGILFLQGESDGSNQNDAESWAKRFNIVLRAFRTDLGPAIPFVFGEIGKLADFPFQDVVRAQQERAALAHPDVAMIRTLDLPTGPDGVHFTVDSYKRIGVRFAAAWNRLRLAHRRPLTGSLRRSHQALTPAP